MAAPMASAGESDGTFDDILQRLRPYLGRYKPRKASIYIVLQCSVVYILYLSELCCILMNKCRPRFVYIIITCHCVYHETARCKPRLSVKISQFFNDSKPTSEHFSIIYSIGPMPIYCECWMFVI